MRVKNLLGKTVIDSAGDDLGKIDDIELNWDDRSVVSIIIKGDPDFKQKIMSSKYGSQIMKSIGATAVPDISIPVSDVKSIGDVVTLTKDI
jgi:sporulation protein YlmC with PRC-barrel domain